MEGIYTSGELIRELQKSDEDFITIRDRDTDNEYVIESIGRCRNNDDAFISHLCLNIRSSHYTGMI